MASSTSAGLAPHPALGLVYGGRPFQTDGEVLALAFAPDGTLWSVEEPSVLRHWDIAGGRQLDYQFLDNPGTVWSFRPDATLLAAGCDDLTIYDVSSGDPLALIRQPSWVTAMTFRGDTPQLATGHDDGTIRLWDAASQKLLRHLPGTHRLAVSALAFSADGKRLASAGEDKVICLWDVNKGELLMRLGGHTDRIPGLAWHPQGKRLFSAGWDTSARIWDTETAAPLFLFNNHSGQVLALAMSRDGELLACADSSDAIHVWRTTNPGPVCVHRGHEDEVRCLAFSANGEHLASGGADRVIRIWSGLKDVPVASPEPATAVARRRAASWEVEPGSLQVSLALSPDGQRLASACGVKTVQVWETASAKPVLLLEDAEPLYGVAWSPDGQRLATAGCGPGVLLCDARTGTRQRLLEGPAGPVALLAFSGDSKVLAAAAARSSDVWLWDVNTGNPVLLIPDAADACLVQALAFEPTRGLLAIAGVDWLATGGSNGAVSVWDIPKRKQLALLEDGGSGVAFRPGGAQVAVAGLDRSVRIYELASESLVQELLGHEDEVTCVAYSPDGKLIASGGSDRTLRLWDAASGSARACMELGTQVQALVFSPDGARIYTANANTSCFQIDVRRLLQG